MLSMGFLYSHFVFARISYLRMCRFLRAIMQLLAANDCHNLGEFSNLKYEDMDFPDGTGGALPLIYTCIALVVLPVAFRWKERLHKGCHEKLCSRVR